VILPDVNVLVNAFRADTVRHEVCRGWLTTVVNSPARFGMSPQVLASVVRVTTHPKVFRTPSTVREALRFCQGLLEAPQCVAVTPGNQHWGIFSRLCVQASAKGNLVSDAWLAALAIEAGCDWITLDADYRRFPGLSFREPA